MSIQALVTGGARSGKSAFAEELVYRLGAENVLYVATAEVPQGDEEMNRRIEEHRLKRPAGWETFEVSYSAPGSSLSDSVAASKGAGAVLLDSLTLWVSGRMADMTNEGLLDELEGFVSAAAGLGVPMVVVSDEVGLGLVPESPEGRRFRDLLGLANQRVAADAAEVYLCVSGVPLRLR